MCSDLVILILGSLLQVGAAGGPVLDGWIVDLHRGGEEAARLIADRHNLHLLGPVGLSKTMFHYQLPERQRRSLHHRHTEARLSREVANTLLHEDGVIYVEPLEDLVRLPRGYQPERCCEEFNDPEYQNQWVYNNSHGLDTNIHGAWKQGYTGKGVVVTILDDGVEYTHQDIIDNWDSNASYDYNDNDSDPSPRIGDKYKDDNMHGTRCAGQVAASANNSHCIIGAAFEAKIGGIRMLDGRIQDHIECRSLQFKRGYVDIYSVSWGPEDNGRTVDGPGRCTKQALRDGAKLGRQGKGSIFVWASGNGGQEVDDCNMDGYVSSIYTIAISALSSQGLSPWYNEWCSATLASAYSSGFGHDGKVWTTDIKNSCTNQHTGTSAATPLAAGVIALALQANPSLTWRDMQHLIVHTASKITNVDRWTKNGAGHQFHPKIGFGALDATELVNRAKNWTNVGPQRKCIALKANQSKVIPAERVLTMTSTVRPSDCSGDSGYQHLTKLEHVQLVLTMSTAVRGDIKILLTSPSGTTTKLLNMRPKDNFVQYRWSGGERRYPKAGGFKNWAFMTVHLWDEYPYGKWQFHISNGGSGSASEGSSFEWAPDVRPLQTKLKKFKLVLYGTGSDGERSEESLELEHGEETVPRDSTNPTGSREVAVDEPGTETSMPTTKPITPSLPWGS